MKAERQEILIKEPRFEYVSMKIRGTAPLGILRYSEKKKESIRKIQEAGQSNRSRKIREAKDFDALYKEATYVSEEGWYGFKATAIRAAAISACRLVGFKMTIGKMTIRVMPDGYDKDTGDPLIKITKGNPQPWIDPVKNADKSMDLRVRAKWMPGWEAVLKLRYDADQFTRSDIVNLINRVGQQVGIGEGRADSPKSCGLEYGYFEIVTEKTKQ